ncbi:MAG: glutamine--fructose-6-phosphate transaminase (isomerizing) [Deltaproteobacteria bacterium]|nr:glutamine--fructose-6-phosphate transaminase (isomerizing) [Deltaproteobacteria bacterium]
MCGIVGYVGDAQCAQLLVSGLKKLEYRGYDSAGIAIHSGGELKILRSVGKLANLEALLARETPPGTAGIGHTRWATHGRPSDENAHPHRYKDVAVVHNGIIENHLALKEKLRAAGHTFSSETDTEIFAHLVSDELEKGQSLPDAVRRAVAQVHGTYALVVASSKFPEQIVATKNASPLVVGLGQGQNFVASDVPALLEHTRDVIFMEEGDLVVIEKESVKLFDPAGKPVTRPPTRINWTPMMAEKNGHKHFMHKEIHEQPRAVADTVRGRASMEEGDVYLDGFTLSAADVQALDKVFILACGTSWHAGLVGKAMIETLAKIPVEVDLASEFRYRDPLVNPKQLAVAISQSGETADTLAALREAGKRGAKVASVCNVVGSNIPRESAFTVYTHAGPEIGVASTKCFTTQLVAMYLLAVKLGRLRGTISASQGQALLSQLSEVPQLLEQALDCEAQVKAMAKSFVHARDVLFLGRGPMFPIALEGALKLKEISYIHAEGYAAGEMKHGPIALIDQNVPVVVLAPKGAGYEKMLGNAEEVRARGGKLFAIVTEGDNEISRLADASVAIPAAPPLLAGILAAVPLQLLAYHVADARGTDVDQPRNLAKSVTVE